MERQANSIFEADEIRGANLPERLAGAELLYKVGGIIGERMTLPFGRL